MATRDQLQDFVCGHGCVLDIKRGMGTNGPCRHMQFPRHLSDEDRRIWRGLLEATRVHRRRADELEAENARLRDAGDSLERAGDKVREKTTHVPSAYEPSRLWIAACDAWDEAKRGTP